MRSSTQQDVDSKINKFLARKEEEIPELRESAEVLYQDLTSPHFSANFHFFQREDAHKRSLRHMRQSRVSGLHYAT